MTSFRVLSTEQFKELNQVHNGLAIMGLFRAWLPVIAAFALMLCLRESWLYFLVLPLAWAVIVSRQHAFALLTHDCVHRSVFKNKKINDWVGRYLFAFPLFISFSRYRAIHMTHHRELYTEEDPDLAIYTFYPVERSKWRRILVRDLMGKTVLKNMAYFLELPSFLRPSRKAELRLPEYESDMKSFYFFQVALLLILTWSGILLDYVLIWVLPYLTVLQVLLRIRGALEHASVSSRTDEMKNTRTVLAHPLILTWMAPLGLNYHLEHHLYPTIPWYRLKRVNEILAASPAGAQANGVTGYMNAVKALVSGQ